MSELTLAELSWARAALETFFPSDACPALPCGIRDLDIEGHLREIRRRAPTEAAVGIRLAIWIVGLAPVFVLGRFCTIARLPPEDRERTLRGLLASPVYFVRQLVMFLKQLGALLYAGAEQVRARLRASAPGRTPSVPAVSVSRLLRAARAAREAS